MRGSVDEGPVVYVWIMFGLVFYVVGLGGAKRGGTSDRGAVEVGHLAI